MERNSLERIPVGKMAELNQISVQTLRFYEKIGLITPDHIDPDSKYRYYTIKQCARLDLIKYLKFMGFSLDEIKAFFYQEDIHAIPSVLQEQIDLIEEKVKELSHMKRTLQVAKENYETCLNIPQLGKIQLEHMKERKIFCYDGERDIYEDDLVTYEYILRELRKQMFAYQFPHFHYCNVGTITRLETILQQEFTSTELFILIDPDYEGTEGIEILPEEQYLTIYCDQFSNEKAYAFKLLEYTERNNLTIIGDYICEVLVDLPLFNHQERRMMMRLQIPVK